MDKRLLNLFGLKWNPFSPELPSEALYKNERLTSFCWRIEHGLVREGGFAMITGDPGNGKSVSLRILAAQLEQLPEITVGVLTHPQSNLADFYREMGDIFGVELRPHNRWAGFKNLRERWKAHLDATLLRPVLLIDEVQEMQPAVLSELRLLASTDFDSRAILSVVLAGDQRLQDKLRHEQLLPLGSRIRTRLMLDYVPQDELLACLRHVLTAAGNPKLMTPELTQTLCEHAMGNYRVLMTMAGELLAVGVQRELEQLDEKLFLDVFANPPRKPNNATRRPPRRSRGPRA